MRYLFRPENRVKRRPEFQSAYSRGKVYKRQAVQVFVAPRPSPDLPTRIGLTATRKVGGSVVRNRLRRLAREAFRLSLPELKPGYDIIVNFHKSAVGIDFRKMRGQLRSAWRDAGLLPPKDTAPPVEQSAPSTSHGFAPEPTPPPREVPWYELPFHALAVALVRAYQAFISPLLPRDMCRFHPSCSNYALGALRSRGLPVALWLIAWRVLRCNPLCAGGYDPVPAPPAPGRPAP